MKGFVDNIEKLTEDNLDFRRVLYTGRNLQLVLMAIGTGEEGAGGATPSIYPWLPSEGPGRCLPCSRT
jgi:hypothetical protein